MQLPDESEISLRSYFIWEQEGCPFGRHAEHWARAEAELIAERANPPMSETDKSVCHAANGKRPHGRKARPTAAVRNRRM